jgi:hypothetical protein
MRKSIVTIVIFSFLFVALLSAAPVYGEDSAPVIIKDYTKNGPISSPASYKYVDPDGANFDLTRGDLTVSYSIDMSNYKPLAEDSGVTFSVGIFGVPGLNNIYGEEGWMACNASGAYNNKPEIFDPNDMFFLEWPYGGAETNYGAYIKSGVIGDWKNMELVNTAFPPWYIWFQGLSPSYGFKFDRSTATSETRYGLVPKGNIKTGGIYKVSITYHSINSVTGVMFATINGVQQGFFGTNPVTMKPQYMPVGKLFNGAQDWAQVFVNLPSDPKLRDSKVQITNLTAVGTPRVPAVGGVDPYAAMEGDVLDARINGESFRNDTGISANFLKANATGNGDAATGEMFAADPVTYLLNSLGHTVLAHIAIPDEATPGSWNVTYKHDDDPVGSRLNNAFTVYRAPPKITGNSVTHSRRSKTFKMDITGRFFRNVPMTVQLGRGNYNFKANSVVWKSKNLITAEFTIPSTAPIAADYYLLVKHNDDGMQGDRPYAFCVEARVDISPNIIWLRAPGFTTVSIYSESGFDATKVISLTVNLGGTLPFWSTTRDLNWDGRKDLQLHYYNGFVTIPTGFVTTVAVAGATSDYWVPVKGFASVTCFRFLF